ncbi:MAG TPA: thiamine pyrophosphate-dependent enzyme [Gaiellaceae bacterium]|nr:thiamine pyrophosphate-dependent enzyme [Gaiellaceae bacterium]
MTVRDATFEVLRRRGMTKIFSNPGSTEVPFLVDLPSDLEFVLALHEGSVVGIATGWALGRGEPAFVLLHTTPGLGNAVSALATSRVNRAPLVVTVGQQDRRHLAHEPFLAGKLAGLAGEYPVWVDQPVRPQDVPGSLERAWHEAQTRHGPALVIVPMDDWQAPAPEPYEHAAPDRLVRAAAADVAAVEELAELLEQAESPALVAGAGADDPETWAALSALAERLVAPVWQEPFGARAGFPQDHPLYAGDLSADRARLREALSGHDVVLVVGAPAFRQYAYAEGPFVQVGTTVALVTEDPAEAQRSRAQLAVLAPPAPVCAALAGRLAQRDAEPLAPTPAPEPPSPDDPLRAGHVLAELAARLPRNAVVLEEAPSNRPELLARLPARENLGLISPAMGGLGFAMPAAIGLRLALPSRPVVAIIGDGSSLYAIQSLWSAATYKSGALFVILKNGGYAIMDRLAEHEGGASAWPNVDVDIAGLAEIFGCDARRIADLDTLRQVLDQVVPGLADRKEPLLLEVTVEPDPDFRS